MKRRPTTVQRSVVRDVPGHPVAAPCTISHCRYTELVAALTAIHTAARGDEKGECWTIRQYLDAHDVFNDNLTGPERLIEEVCKLVLRDGG